MLFIILLLIPATFALIQQTVWSASNQTFHSQLDSRGNVILYWKINYEKSYLLLEVQARLPQTNRFFFALGFSDYGEFKNADFCVFWMSKNGKRHFQDTWTDDNGFLNLDSQNDCEFLASKLDGNSLTFVFKRKLQTCDPHDHVIEDGTNHVLYAMGNLNTDNVYGLRIQNVKLSGFQRLSFLKNLNPTAILNPNITNINAFVVDQVKVPPVETTYWCKVHTLPSLFSKKRHLVRYEPIIKKGNEGVVHHMELFHCEVDAKQKIPMYNGPCNHHSAPEILKKCRKVVAAWAMGATGISYPEVAGLAMGGTNYSLFVMQEVHYNNPEQIDSFIDSSGFRLFHTDHLRQFDISILEIGLEYSPKNSIPPGQPHFTLSGFCADECTRASLPESGILVIASQLHTHLTGVKVKTRHIRGGKELRLLNYDNYYSTHFQEIRQLKRQVRVYPGDQLITTCTYNSENRNQTVLGGYGIKDEMCVNYIHYYPSTDLEVCKSSVDTEHLWNFFHNLQLEHLQPIKLPKNADQLNDDVVEKAFRDIHWTPYLVKTLHKFYEQAPLSVQCNRSSGYRFPGNWNGISQNVNFQPFLEEKNECPINLV